MMPLDGRWYWCKLHLIAEFITLSFKHTSFHDCVGPYPTQELAEEFGQKSWGTEDYND